MWLDELKKMKDARGYTTREIAIGANLPEPTLEKIFSGATRDPKLTTIQTLVHFLGYKLDDLTPEDNIKKAPVEQGLSAEQIELLKLFDASDADGRDLLLQFARYTAKSNNRAHELTDEERVRAALHRHMMLDSRQDNPADRAKLSI